MTLVKQPNSRWCFACGLENPIGLKLAFYETGKDQIEASYTAPAHFQGYPGVLHGGIVVALLDEVVGRTAMIGDHENFMVTATLDVRFRQPVPIEEPLRLVGRLASKRSRRATASASLLIPDGTVAAEARALLAALPGEPMRRPLLESLGWKVYPDE